MDGDRRPGPAWAGLAPSQRTAALEKARERTLKPPALPLARGRCECPSNTPRSLTLFTSLS